MESSKRYQDPDETTAPAQGQAPGAADVNETPEQRVEREAAERKDGTADKDGDVGTNRL